MPTNRLDQARSFLARRGSKLALQVVPIALMAAAAAHATPSFSAPNSTGTTSGCSGGLISGSLTGVPTNNGLGVSLSGLSTLTQSNTTCTLNMQWIGTGSGTFLSSTATIGSSFSITAPTGVTVQSWILKLYINGTQRGQYTCSSNCSGYQTLATQNFAVPASLSTYEVDLSVTAAYAGGNNILTVLVPGSATIDILSVAAASVPVLTPVALGATTLLLLALATYQVMFRKQTHETNPIPRK